MFKNRRKKESFSWKRFLKRLFWLILLVLFLGISFWTLFCSDYTKIVTIEINSEKIEKKALKDISDNLKSQKILDCLNRDNFFLFPRKKFADLTKDQFKIVREVRFENIFPHQITINLETREAMIVFCSRGECFLLDEEGVLFYKLQNDEKDNRFGHLNLIIDKGFSEVNLGQEIESFGLASLIKDLEKELSEKTDLEFVKEMETPSLISEEIRVKTKKGWQIYFNLENDISIQVELLKEVLSSVIGNDLDNLNYIDLRVNGKAIYNVGSNTEKQNSEKEGDEESKRENNID